MGEKRDFTIRLWGRVSPYWPHIVAIVVGVPLAILSVRIVVLFFEVMDVAKPTDDLDAIRNLGLVLGGLLGLAFAVWRGTIAKQQSAAAEAQVQRQQDRDYADLFTKAVEQLGATREIRSKDGDGNDLYEYKPNIEVRLGAIYALERISRASEKDHIAIIETLCAYVRENAPGDGCADWERPKDLDPKTGFFGAHGEAIRGWVETLETPRADIQAALTVIGRRTVWPSETQSGFHLDLRGANLRRADMTKAELSRALLTGTRMEGADLRQAKIESADLKQAKMEGAKLSEAKMEGADLWQAKMEGANLRHAKMEGADLSEAKMEGAKLSEAKMEGANLWRAKMEGAYLSQAKMEGANLTEAKMEGAYLTEAKMDGAYLTEAKMEGADLTKAKMEGAKLTLVTIDSVNASLADFTDAEDLTQEMLDSCFGCAGTKLPEYAEAWRPAHWHPEPLEDWMEGNKAYSIWKAARESGEMPDWAKS